ncbi:hypothetical protein B0J11DRAFT_487400 [Dendryphion nanum]|uniref:FAD/NAD(P)-binding domain-containing protein n=1 Tax=Dendryphion nanum TaxID=256645 RepID=A0A9P9DW58_9PLEO|nr:hypothetical protein B0J11DRAFT_487400 [Dendryphion nanum]
MRLQSVPDVLNPLSTLGNLSLATPHRILIVGCAYGGISALVNLIDLGLGRTRQTVYAVPDVKGKKTKNGIEITVIDERDGYFHSVGAPLAHVTPKHTSKMWKRYSQIQELRQNNVSFKHGSVQKIDAEAKVAEWRDQSGKTQHQGYDYVIFATGLKRHWPAVPKSGSWEQYVKDGKALHDEITGGSETSQQGRKVVIIGAGAVGVEFAAEIKNYYPSISVTLIHSRSEVLSSEPLPSEVKAKAQTLLVEEGVDLILENRATITALPTGKKEVTLANGTSIIADTVIDSTKKGVPTTGFLPVEAVDEAAEIKVTPHLSFQPTIPNASSHFGVGDCIAWSGIKRAGGAMLMGELAAHNVYTSILNDEADSGTEPIVLTELPVYNNVIGLAVGKQCLTYDKGNGMKWGVQLMKDYFQDDLGWAANLKYLQLTEVEERKEKAMEKEKLEGTEVRVGEVGVEAVGASA